MNKAVSLFGALGVGAGLMYFLDPDRGRRRRALMEDQALHLAKKTNGQIGKRSRDFENRTKGIISETKRIFSRETVTDEQLNGRIRSRIGRLASHPHAIKTEVADGRVRLGGQILADEVETLLSGVSGMRGVKEIENNLEVHATGENIPALQPNRRTAEKNGEAHSGRNPNLSSAARLLTTAAGLGCAVYAAKKRGAAGLIVGAAGTELLAFGLSNNFLENPGTNGGKGIAIQKAIHIAAPPEKVYEICSRPENFPLFMSHVREVRRLGERLFQWTTDGFPGMPVVFHTEVTEIKPNEFIRWRSAQGERIEQTGEMRFEPAGENETRLHIRMFYHPPTGYFGHVFARLFRLDPKSEMDDDLLRMKSYVETGKIPRDAYAEIQKRRFRNMKIKEIMTENPACCEPDANLQQVARLMLEKNCGAIPVVEDGQIKKPIGIITDRDVTVRAVAQGKNPADSAVKDFMTTAVLSLTPEASLEECCELMEKNQVRRMLVVDENGSLAGIVAQADIARKAPEYETAELVKDISMPAQAAAAR